MAIFLYVTASPPPDYPLGYNPFTSKKYLRELELYGGKLNIIAVQLLSVLVLSVGLGSLGAYAEDSPEKSAQMAAETWLGHVDAGEYATSWKEASSYFQGTVTEKAWAAALHGVRRPLGKVMSRTF